MALNPLMVTWHQRTVWLVGASSGIGMALATRLHAEGARVIISARQADLLSTFANAHPGSVALPLDVTDRTNVFHAARAAVAAAIGGRIDLVVYCAGFYRPLRADTFDLDVALHHQQVNVQGALHVLGAMLQS